MPGMLNNAIATINTIIGAYMFSVINPGIFGVPDHADVSLLVPICKIQSSCTVSCNSHWDIFLVQRFPLRGVVHCLMG